MSFAIGKNLSEVSDRYEYDPVSGRYRIRVYEGTHEAVLGVIRSLDPKSQAYAVDDTDRPRYRITIRTPDEDATLNPSDTTNTWELLGNEIQKDMYELPKFKAVSDADIRTIRDALNNPGNSAPTLTGDAQTLYNLVLKGATVFYTTEFVLRKTQTVSVNYQTKVAFDDIDKLHTHAQVITAEAIPLDILFAIDQIPTPTEPTGFLWRWLKRGPEVRASYGAKAQIIQEYWLDLWPADVYAQAT